ncbi:MAG: adenylyltransferase/cytidyltransferase family protein [Candidatus Aminicenantes bacterium]|nr:adenylyltransferase/cytidyltransferase family protein [Candidatus Aminicenantes bacterium]
MIKTVAIVGSFDDLRSRQVRFLEEAAKIGDVHAWVWPDAAVKRISGKPAKFPAGERLYIVQSLRFVKSARIATGSPTADAVPGLDVVKPQVWAVPEGEMNDAKRTFGAGLEIEVRTIPETDLIALPPAPPLNSRLARQRKVIVSGCYDWLHSGHIRFFEEASGYGDLFVDVGSDANIRMLKGKGHPLLGQDTRLYMVLAVKHVKQAFVGSGFGWLDAAPEISRIKPDVYLVNDDGDRPEKREFCEGRGIQYVVLKRTPKSGLPSRDSTSLRGF